MEREEIMAMLEKDIQTIANNHGVEASVTNPDEDGDFVANVYSVSIPTLADVRLLTEAYGLRYEDSVDCFDSWGFTNIYVMSDQCITEPDPVKREMCGATRKIS